MDAKKAFFWMSSGGVQTLSSPDLYANNIYTSQIVLNWTSGYDSYSLERSVNSDYSSSSIIYSGALATYTDTGLTADTTYYYRIKGTISGVTSEWRNVTSYTVPTLVAHYQTAGTTFASSGNITNDFGTTNLNNIVSLKSVFGTSGPLLSRTAGSWTRDYTPIDTAYCLNGFSASGYGDFASQINLGTGAFSIAFKAFVASSFGGSSNLFSDTATGEVMRIDAAGILVRINGVFSTKMTWPVAYTVGSKVDLIIEYSGSGSNMRSSITGGATWSNSVARPSAASNFVFTRIAASQTPVAVGIGFESLSLSNYQLSSAQLVKIFGWYQGETFVNTGVDLTETLKHLPATFETVANNYITSFTAGILSKGHGYGLSKNVWSVGDYDLILLNQKLTSPEYRDGYLFVHNRLTGQVYSGILIPHFATTEDIHECGSMSLFNNSVWIEQMSRHYGGNEGSNYHVRKFLEDFDFTSYTDVPQSKGVATTYFLSDSQYHQSAVLGNIMATFSQRRQPSSPINPGRIMCGLSTDGLQGFYSYFPIVDVGDVPASNDWLYPIIDINGDREEVTITIEHVLAAITPVRSVAISKIKTKFSDSPFEKWWNIEETYSKVVKSGSTLTPLSDTEVYANCMVLDARSLTSTAWSHGYCTTDGMLYGVVGNGSNTGWKLYYQNQGEAMNLKDISFDGDTVVTGTQTDTTGTFTFSYHRSVIIAIYKGGTIFEVVAMQVNGGNWCPTLYRSTNMGDTWVKIGILNGIDTGAQHTELEISQNYHFNNDQGVLVCSKATSSTLGIPYRRDVNNLV